LTTKNPHAGRCAWSSASFHPNSQQAADITPAPALLDGQSGDGVLGDKAHDGKALRAIIADIGTTTLIPSNRNRKIIIPYGNIRLPDTAHKAGGKLPALHGAKVAYISYGAR
jgi:hypothetical protein